MQSSSLLLQSPLEVVTWLQRSHVLALSNPQQLYDDGAVPSLVDLIRTPLRDPQLRVRALETLRPMATQLHLARDIVDSPGALRVLCDLVDTDVARGEEGGPTLSLVLSVLRSLCLGGDATHELCAAGIVKQLLTLCTSDEVVAGYHLGSVVALIEGLLASPLSEGVARQAGIYDVVGLVCKHVPRIPNTVDDRLDQRDKRFMAGINLLRVLEGSIEDPLNSAALCRSPYAEHFFALIACACAVGPSTDAGQSTSMQSLLRQVALRALRNITANLFSEKAILSCLVVQTDLLAKLIAISDQGQRGHGRAHEMHDENQDEMDSAGESTCSVANEVVEHLRCATRLVPTPAEAAR